MIDEKIELMEELIQRYNQLEFVKNTLSENILKMYIKEKENKLAELLKGE